MFRTKGTGRDFIEDGCMCIENTLDRCCFSTAEEILIARYESGLDTKNTTTGHLMKEITRTRWHIHTSSQIYWDSIFLTGASCTSEIFTWSCRSCEGTLEIGKKGFIYHRIDTDRSRCAARGTGSSEEREEIFG